MAGRTLYGTLELMYRAFKRGDAKFVQELAETYDGLMMRRFGDFARHPIKLALLYDTARQTIIGEPGTTLGMVSIEMRRTDIDGKMREIRKIEHGKKGKDKKF